MKFRQQIQTSAKQLLGKSGQGFGTVAAHPEIPRAVREYTDNLGITLIEGEVTASYCFARVEGWILLNRTIVAPADQTGRSNHVAHTLAVPESEVQTWLDAQKVSGEALWSPATLMLQFEGVGTWREAWKEDPRELGEADLIDIPTTMEGSSWLPTVWQEHPEKALAALTTDTKLKPLKWNWEGIDVAVEQLRCYAQTFAVMDPDQGKKRHQPEIERLFPENLRCSWEWTFATVLIDSQKPDDFKWFGISKARTKGSTSTRAEFVPAQAETSPVDDRVGYVKNKEEAITKMNREAYDKAAIKLKSLLEEWQKGFGKKFPKEYPAAPDCVAEVDAILRECCQTRTISENKQNEVNILRQNVAHAEKELNESKDILKGWFDFANSVIESVQPVSKPTSLTETLQEFNCASEKWNDDKVAELGAEYERLKSVSQSLESKINELRNETNHLKQTLNTVQPPRFGALNMPREVSLPRPSAASPIINAGESRALRDAVPSAQISLAKHLTPNAQITEDRNIGPKAKNTKREANTIWMWILGTTFMLLIGVIGWGWGQYCYSEGENAGKHKERALLRAAEVFTPPAKTSIPSKTSSPTGSADSPKPLEPMASEQEQSAPVTKPQDRMVKKGTALNELTPSTPQPDSRPKSNEMSGAKGAPQNPQVETLMNEDASRSPQADLQGKPAGKSPEPTASPTSKEASQDGKAAGKTNSSPKASEPSAPMKDNQANDDVKPGVVPNTPELSKPEPKSEPAKTQ